MCKTKNVLTTLLLIGALAAVCQATPSFEWVLAEEPGPVGGATYPAGYTSWDLMYTVDTNVSIVEMYLQSDTPAPGDFYQNPNNPDGGITGPPSAGVISSDPFAEFDTYLTIPGSFGVLVAATDIVPDPDPPIRDLTFNDQLLDVSWGLGPEDFSGPGTFQVARVTLKDAVYVSYTVMGFERVEPTRPPITFEGILPAPLPGDASLDGRVSLIDLDILGKHYRQAGDWGWRDADFSGDGMVTLTDLDILGRNYGTDISSEPASQAIPEPATLGLLVIGGLVLVRRRR